MQPGFGVMVTEISGSTGKVFARGLTSVSFYGKFAPEKGCDEDTRGRSDPQREAGW